MSRVEFLCAKKMPALSLELKLKKHKNPPVVIVLLILKNYSIILSILTVNHSSPVKISKYFKNTNKNAPKSPQ